MTRSNRIYGLDAAKAILLIGGPLVHSVFSNDQPLAIRLIEEISHSFRMPAFFVISGFIVAMIPAASDFSWLRSRARQILVPFLTMSLVLGFLILALKDHLPITPRITRLYPSHLWFLIALAVISPITIVMDKTTISAHLTRLFERHPYLLPIIALGLTCGIRLETALYAIVFDEQLRIQLYWAELFFIITPKYLVYYLLGFFLGRSPRLVAMVPTRFVSILAVVTLAFIAILFIGFSDSLLAKGSTAPLKFVRVFVGEFAAIVCSIAIVAVAMQIKKPPQWIMTWSKSSYSVYLFHQPVILVTLALFNIYHFPFGPYVTYLVMAGASLGVSYLIHLQITKSDLMMFLFNGKKLPTLNIFQRSRIA